MSISPELGQLGPKVQLRRINILVISDVYGLDSQGRPTSTLTSRHMLEIQNDKAMSVRLFARQSDTVTSSTACNFGVINTNVCCSISLADQSLTFGLASIDIIDVSVRWIIALSLCKTVPYYGENRRTVKKLNMLKKELES